MLLIKTTVQFALAIIPLNLAMWNFSFLEVSTIWSRVCLLDCTLTSVYHSSNYQKARQVLFIEIFDGRCFDRSLTLSRKSVSLSIHFCFSNSNKGHSMISFLKKTVQKFRTISLVFVGRIPHWSVSSIQSVNFRLGQAFLQLQ